MDSTPEVHNREADASTEDLEAEMASNAIGSTLVIFQMYRVF